MNDNIDHHERLWQPAWRVWQSWLPANSPGIVVGVAFGGQVLHHASLGHRVVGLDPYCPYDPKDVLNCAPELMDARYQRTLERIGDKAILRRMDLTTYAVDHPEELAEAEWIFIDGDHRYEAVKRDIQIALSAKIPLVGGHDFFPTGWPGVVRAVDECKPEGATIVADGWSGCWKYER